MEMHNGYGATGLAQPPGFPAYSTIPNGNEPVVGVLAHDGGGGAGASSAFATPAVGMVCVGGANNEAVRPAGVLEVSANNALGFMDRDSDPQACSCPPMRGCCSMPVWAASARTLSEASGAVAFDQVSRPASLQFGCCSWTAENVDVGVEGAPDLTFRYSYCCGRETNWCQGEITAFQHPASEFATAAAQPHRQQVNNQQLLPLGRVEDIHPCSRTGACCCFCGCWQWQTFAQIEGSGDNPSRFVAQYKFCGAAPGTFHVERNACGWQKFRYPIRRADHRFNAIMNENRGGGGGNQDDNNNNSDIVAFLATRFHACMPCHPLYVGVELPTYDDVRPGGGGQALVDERGNGAGFPATTLTPAEQSLLLALALSRFWYIIQQNNNQ